LYRKSRLKRPLAGREGAIAEVGAVLGQRPPFEISGMHAIRDFYGAFLGGHCSN